METQTVILTDNDYVVLRYLPEPKMLYHTILKPVDEAVFKDVLDTGTNALKTYSIKRWLSDDRNNGPFSAEFMQWSLEDWIPRTIANGWKSWANVVPQDLMAAGTLVPIIDKLYEYGLRMAVFTSVTQAMQWLQKN